MKVRACSWGFSSVLEPLPSKHKALGSVLSSKKKKKKRKRKKERRKKKRKKKVRALVLVFIYHHVRDRAS